MNIQDAHCAIAYKEWAGVRDALWDGRQTILIRKGGVAESEGPGGFQPEHAQFWIYPTHIHEGEQGLRAEADPVRRHESAAGTVLVNVFAHVQSATWFAREESLDLLARFHVLKAETMNKRFHYRRPGLWVLLTRVFVARPGFTIAIRPEDAGCKTWVSLDQPLSTAGLTPALDDRAWRQTASRFERLLEANS